MAALLSSLSNVSELVNLFKRRCTCFSNNGSAIPTSDDKSIVQETNHLLKQGIITSLCASIRSDLKLATAASLSTSSTIATTAAAPAPAPTTTAQETTVDIDQCFILRLKADALFFIFYQTQIEQRELDDLTELVRELSNLVVGINMSDTSIATSNRAWWCTLYNVLVQLQLAHVCATQQTTFLSDRKEDNIALAEAGEIGNNLPQTPGDRCKMDGDDSSASTGGWLCDGVKGFVCLSFGILRQPEVDLDRAPARDVEFFLHEANIRKVYSHIR